MQVMEDTEKTKNKRMAIKISKYKGKRHFNKVSYFNIFSAFNIFNIVKVKAEILVKNNISSDNNFEMFFFFNSIKFNLREYIISIMPLMDP